MVQREGAVAQTLRGLYALDAARPCIEIRVLLVKPSLERLAQLARYITRNLPFVEHVALMGIEPIGYAGFIHGFLICDAFDKGLTLLAMGQTHVHKYLPELPEFIEDGDLEPDIIISHRMKLADATEGYRIFDQKKDDCRKVVLTP